MRNQLKADSRTRGKVKIVAVCSLRPALTSIPGACDYLGGISNSKFYDSILDKLDVVKLGARTFITLRSLDRLIEANRQQRLADTSLPPIEGEPRHRKCSEQRATPATGSALLPPGLLVDQGARSTAEPAPESPSALRSPSGSPTSKTRTGTSRRRPRRPS